MYIICQLIYWLFSDKTLSFKVLMLWSSVLIYNYLSSSKISQDYEKKKKSPENPPIWQTPHASLTLIVCSKSN